jgi:hypothetical protein
MNMVRFQRHQSAFQYLVVIIVLAIPALTTAAANGLVLDNFGTSAPAAWIPGEATPEALIAGGLEWAPGQFVEFPCNFSLGQYRCYWTKTFAPALDLRSYTHMSFEIYVPIDFSCLDKGTSITIYFGTGEVGSGWYKKSASITRTGWQTIDLDLTSDSTLDEEGTFAGWDAITQLRFSWKRGTCNHTSYSAPPTFCGAITATRRRDWCESDSEGWSRSRGAGHPNENPTL